MPKKTSPPAAPRQRSERKNLAKKIFATPTIAPERNIPFTIAPDLIARRAHELFVEQGSHHGRDLEHWLAAERELLAAASA